MHLIITPKIKYTSGLKDKVQVKRNHQMGKKHTKIKLDYNQ